MSWRFGIPDFIGNYTYFRDLGNTDQNVPAAAARKQALLGMAMGAVSDATASITDIQNINAANAFIESVAKSERNKEIAAIRSFCKETGKTFPSLQPYLDNPESIYEEPDIFYANLTAALNEIRRGTEEYLTELRRIQSNIKEQGRTLENYKADDYRYRLNGDISSFLNRLRGRYRKIADESAWSLKVQNIAMRILDKMNITSALVAGEDFAAIAASVLIEVEQQVQKEVDEMVAKGGEDKDLANVTDDILDKVEKRYLKQLQEGKEQSPVQRALLNLQGIDFARVTDNAKKLLGIKTRTLSEQQMKKHMKNLNARDRYNKNDQIAQIRATVAQNTTLRKNLSLIDFNISGTAESKHGTIYELVESIITTGGKVRGNVATDIITYNIAWQFQRSDAGMDQLIKSIGESFSSVIDSTEMDKPANVRDLRDTLARMNAEVEELIRQAELQLKENKQFQDKDIFVFHESLKLYSSAETDRGSHSKFGGRVLSIMTYIDYLQSAAEVGMAAETGLGGAVSRDDLAFLARNLTPGAVADDKKEPLEQYFSMYAGMVMFDDLANMAQEAINEVNATGDVIGGKIRQIHLYNLNGIYVPASMVLSYVSDTVKGASEALASGTAATAKITVPKVNQKYKKWQDGDGRLYPSDWQDVAAESASQTKVKITFLAIFKNFIERLGSL